MSDKMKNKELTIEAIHFINKLVSADVALDKDTDTDLETFIKSMPQESFDDDGYYIPKSDRH